jgi:hypothetical protein
MDAVESPVDMMDQSLVNPLYNRDKPQEENL